MYSNPYSLVDTSSLQFSYDGSLTTPPCTEGIQWRVQKNTVPISMENYSIVFEKFKHNLSKSHQGHNCRPLQESNNRKIKLL